MSQRKAEAVFSISCEWFSLDHSKRKPSKDFAVPIRNNSRALPAEAITRPELKLICKRSPRSDQVHSSFFCA
jgi:hypothetical protein